MASRSYDERQRPDRERELYDALQERLEDRADAEQDDAAMDDRGYSPRGYESAMPRSEAMDSAFLDFHEYLEHYNVDDLIDGDNLPPEAEGFSKSAIRRVLAQLKRDWSADELEVRGLAGVPQLDPEVRDALYGQFDLFFENFVELQAGGLADEGPISDYWDDAYENIWHDTRDDGGPAVYFGPQQFDKPILAAMTWDEFTTAMEQLDSDHFYRNRPDYR